MARSRRRDRAPRPDPTGSNRTVAARRLSVTSAALLLVGGYVHLCLYRHGYRFIPKIGVSFLLQAGSSILLATALVVVGWRFRMRRPLQAVPQLVRLAAMALSLGTLAALGLAHTSGGLFQFREIGLRPAPQTLIAIVAESLAVLLLGIAMIEGRSTLSSPRATVTSEWPRPRPASGAA
jgi:hypothetical protein